ncbi:MAG: hypothetical protein RL685_7411 [Pseudomonadota bacterium]
MLPIRELTVQELYRATDPSALPFETTARAPRSEDFIGQDQAMEAVEFGVAVRREGYNLFAIGPSGVGKQSVLRQLLGQRASQERPGEDWCYVNNFDDAHRPHAMALPAGRAAALRADLERTVSDLQVAVRTALEGEEHRTRRQRLMRELADRQERAFRESEQRARQEGVHVAREQDSFTVRPLREGRAMLPAEFDELPEPDQQRLREVVARAEDSLGVALQEFNDWDRQHREALEALLRRTAAAAGAKLFEELRAAYADLPAVLEHLADIEADLADSAAGFLEEEEEEGSEPSRRRRMAPEADGGAEFEQRASVNVVIDHAEAEGAPVVYEPHPTLANLMGRIEHSQQFGSMIADFTLIRPGAVHRALGGYLVLEAARLLEHPQAWQALKRTLQSGEISLESQGQQPDGPVAVSLTPEPIPFADTKVILLGERELYEVLADTDPDFLELFKVLVDFDDVMDRTPASEASYANLVAWLAFKDGLREFTRGGVARVLEHAARLADDSGRLSVRMRSILDLMREADSHASLANAQLITAEHVQRAIEQQSRRSGSVRIHLLENIRDGITLLQSAGSRVGQVNGLSVVRSGEHGFGQVVRITARVWVGHGDVIDIERDVDLAGPLHAKGVLICKGFLGQRYATEVPLSLSASLVFEQSYGSVEGDSASVAETCALLSALANVPVLQSIAITGSMNQHGEVQAVGGVNEKIEGFFDVCREQGLSGAQGVVIPASNVRHLMLSHEVVAAVREGKFHVWAAADIDQALELLTGREAGRQDDSGAYPAGSLNAAVQQRLRSFAEVDGRFRARVNPAQR